MSVCALSFVARMPPNHHRRRWRRRLWRPVIAPPSTSARVQSRFEIVELGGNMLPMCQGEVPGVTGSTSEYQVPGTRYQALSTRAHNIWTSIYGSYSKAFISFCPGATFGSRWTFWATRDFVRAIFLGEGGEKCLSPFF